MWIAQISDPHLRPEGSLYREVLDPAAALAAAVAQINDLTPLPDLVLLTGDVAETADPAEYALARRILGRLRMPLLAIPGNHDEREAFRAAFHDQPGLPADGPLHFAADGFGPVRILALDVTVPGRHHGAIDEAGFAWLAAALAAEPRRPSVLMLHQPPVECGVPYLDAYRCHDGARLAALLAQFPAVERVLCGHVHRAMQQRFGGTLLCTAPSTATAIALRPWPGAAPASNLEPPGFLLHHWEGGRMLTHHLPVGAYPGPFPFA